MPAMFSLAQSLPLLCKRSPIVADIVEVPSVGQGLFCVLGMSNTNFFIHVGLADRLQLFRDAVPGGDGTVLVCAIPFSIVEPGASAQIAPTRFQMPHFPAPSLRITGLNHTLVYCFPNRQDIRCWT